MPLYLLGQGAIKLAKLHTGRKGFISMLKAFHGKTLGSLSLMGKKMFPPRIVKIVHAIRIGLECLRRGHVLKSHL